ncbi:MAG TPA: hypothetical protein VGM72_04550, partial [Micropepsaceae bacterium]
MLNAVSPRQQEGSLDEALARATAPVSEILDRALNGNELGFSDGILLGDVAGDDLIALVKTADEMRRRKIGETITYVVNRNINFTNICFVGCAFCG